VERLLRGSPYMFAGRPTPTFTDGFVYAADASGGWQFRCRREDPVKSAIAKTEAARKSIRWDRRCVLLDLTHHLAFGLGQQAFLVFLVITPEDEPEDDRQRQQGPADGSRNAAYAFAEQVTAGSEYRRPNNSAGRIEDKEAPGRESVRTRE
jgi:hypothetical protein